MLFGYITLTTALIISLSAAIYSILGLTAIFASAFWPIVIMGGSLEIGKIVTTLWLHKYWNRAEIQYKVYLCSAVAVLMLLTSMGVFGFLSKAHTDQGLVSGDVGAKIAVYDEKIKIEKDNIDANRKALQQMDAAVDQVMGRSTDEKGADKAVAIRRSQAKERSRLLAEIADSQKKVTALNEERAPIAAENRKVEAEVGPIKYIAALIYGDNPDANVLEKSVRWVIILIVAVFDPLALTLLLAATKTFEWERGVNIFEAKKRDEEDPFGEWTEEDFAALEKDLVDNIKEDQHTHIPVEDYYRAMNTTDENPIDPYIIDSEQKKSRWSGFSFPMGSIFNNKEESVKDSIIDDGHDDEYDSPEEKEAKRRWKDDHPDETIKEWRRKYANGLIKDLPWHDSNYYPDYQKKLGLEADNAPTGSTGEVKGFGIQFPAMAVKGDMFLRVDQIPSVLYKFNGRTWIEVDKSLTDQHAYDTAYIDHLISKIESGEYDLDLLSDAERDAIEQRLG
jgi:hypothetical protein